MNESKIQRFKELYSEFKKTEDYDYRVKQLPLAPVFKEIIWETIHNNPITNKHLTGLIQMFKFDCSDANFDKYIEQNIPNIKKREELIEKVTEINQPGYTNAGLTAIRNLDQKQLNVVKRFLNDSFSIKTAEEAVKICEKFDTNNIPFVKEGIYSPWLYYINPEIFPIINNRHKTFLNWMEIGTDYPGCIQAFKKLKEAVDESDLGLLDNYTYQFKADIPRSKILNLNGARFYKMSHGDFVKKPNFRNTGIIKILENNNWICLNLYTKKGQGKNFNENLRIGDYVYVSYGGAHIYCIAKVLSDSQFLDPETDAIINGEGDWIYREIEPLFFPNDPSTAEFKNFQEFYMPSGYSTFWEVPKVQLDWLNENIFLPKWNLKIIDDESTKNQIENNPKINENMPNLNTILYGPPGTGKTYNTVNKALEIIGVSLTGKKRSEIKEIFDENLNSGRIVFTTFHQSMSYEDFVEGLKPIEPKNEGDPVIYKVKTGLFQEICIEAAFDIAQIGKNKTTEEVLDFSDLYDNLADSVEEKILSGEVVKLKTKNGGFVLVESISQQGNFIIKHIDGARTYTVSKSRLTKLQSAIKNLDDVNNINNQFRAIIGGSNSSAYWSVLNAIRIEKRPKVENKENRKYTFEEKESVVKSLSMADYKNKSGKPFILIIDEINRGNVSQIFGELITLIEPDKRLGNDEALETTLPYSKEKFGVPPNLFIIGTMNTADRSVEALDTALRRRFVFEYIAPQPDLLVHNETGEDIEIEGLNLRKLLDIMNERISYLLDEDHQIGHSYLMDIQDKSELLHAFKNKIIPLLREYFYSDFGKIAMVLGDGFVKINKPPTFAGNNQDYIDTERMTYSLIDLDSEGFNIVTALKTTNLTIPQ